MNEVKDWFLVFLTWLGLDLVGFKSGMVGGLLSLIYEKNKKPRQAAVAIAAGAVMAGYVGPLAGDLLDIGEKAYGGLCFIIGLLAMRLVPWIYDAVRERIDEVVKNGGGGTKKKGDG